MIAGQPEVYLGLGANLGNRAANLRLALRYLDPLAAVTAVSSLYETAPIGVEEQPPFYNAVCRLTTGLTPEGLLRHLKTIEFEIGRRPGPRWGARPIDLDLLLYGDVVLEGEGLVLPHSLVAQRAFVLVPLAQLAPDLMHPVLGRTIRELLAALDEAELAGVREVDAPGWEKEPQGGARQ
ncbi:MAG: 2-amino-4-hydroxy-6-hydroxymethyldihydropteridine diphosphokinase [Dehalococcoidia bacterium]|jgi:2-amino-4-hydroxy-6-hydroxymethyldihydropteridine diphosphokinase